MRFRFGEKVKFKHDTFFQDSVGQVVACTPMFSYAETQDIPIYSVDFYIDGEFATTVEEVLEEDLVSCDMPKRNLY